MTKKLISQRLFGTDGVVVIDPMKEGYTLRKLGASEKAQEERATLGKLLGQGAERLDE